MSATAHDHDHAAHAAHTTRSRPTPLASGVSQRLVRVAVALAVLWLAVIWALAS